MKIPYICDKCDYEEWVSYVGALAIKCSNCGERSGVNYQDNYERAALVTPCQTCVHNTVGDGSKCNYCSNI